MIENVQIDELYKQMAQSIIEGETELAVELAQKSIELQMHPLDTITKGFVVGVNYIGDQFGKGEAFLPELVMAGEAMKAAVATLEPELLKLGEAREVMGRVVLAEKSGRLHDSGSLRLTLKSIEAGDRSIPVITSSVFAKGASHKKRNVALIGGGAGAGALIGGLTGGGKGALIGTAVGAGAGTGTAYATGKKDVSFAAERRLTFRLNQAVQVQ